MTKILIWIVVVLVALVGLRMLNIAKAKRREESSERGGSGGTHAGTMVRCTRCGVYLPREEALTGPAGPTCGDPACAKRR